MKKVFFALCVSALMLAQNPVVAVNAIAAEESVEDSSENSDTKAAYLISNSYLSISNSNGQLCINGSTIGVTTMASIGFVNISIERSSNGVSGWSHAYGVSNVLNANALRCDFNNKLIDVASGYYYRVVLDHYAKETGWFPRTQSEGNTSNVVYIG